MSGVMYLGNQMVTPVIVKGNAEYVGRELTPEGKYQTISDTTYTLPEAVKDVGNQGCAFLFYGNGSLRTFGSGSLENISGSNAFNNFFGYSSVINVNFNSVKTVTGNGSCSQIVYECKTVENLSFNSLESINGNRCFTAFADINEYDGRSAPLFSFNFDNLKTINGDEVFYQGIYYRKVKNIRFPSLETIIGDNVFNYFYRELADTLETIEFPKLKVVAGSFGNIISSSDFPKLTSVDFSSLEELGEYGFNYLFGGRPTNISLIEFPKLKKLDSEALARFAPKSLKVLIFGALNSESFGEYTDQFDSMLNGCSDCTVYFPRELESVIGDWSDVLGGFGGTNTSVVFALPMTIVIESTPSNAEILFNGYKNGNNLICINDTNYYGLFDSSTKRAIFLEDSEYTEGSVKTISIDMNDYTYNKITINLGASLDNLKLTWNGLSIPLQEEETGVYSCYINATVGETFTVSSESLYYIVNDSFTTTGSDMTISVTPVERELRSFVRPNLASNGTVGGSNFAVTASLTTDAYKAVDSSQSSYWWSGDHIETAWFTFYNPKPLNISSLYFKWTSYNRRPTEIEILGSNDNTTWESLGNFSVTNDYSYTAEMSNIKFYKYYKLYMKTFYASIRICDIVINALEDISE